MSRRLKYDMPGPDWRRTVGEVAESGWQSEFAAPLGAPWYCVVEIGFGRGEFLLDMAERHPERAFIGVEVSFKRVLKMARRLALTNLENLRLVSDRGERVVDDLSPGSVRELWINFPDPWPKKRQAKHRVVQPAFVASVAECLAEGGELHVATDDRAYAEQIDQVLFAEPRLENVNWPLYWKPQVEGRGVTAYERAWRAEGRPLHFFAYRRRG